MATLNEQATTPAMPIYVDVELSNWFDEDMARRGERNADHVRHSSLSVLAEGSTTWLSIPQDEIDKLGVRLIDERTHRFTNGQIVVERIYGPVLIRVMGRDAIVSATPAPRGKPSKLGMITLGSLDLEVDPTTQRLVPGHPESPDDQVIDC